MRLTHLYLFVVSALLCGCRKEAPQKPQPAPLSDAALLDTVQKQTFRYFWEFAEPNSGLARERFFPDGNYPEKDGHIVTTGGSGFGLMAILSGVNQRYITRARAVERLGKIAAFLENADRFHGAWPHWLNGKDGKVVPFSQKDNGGDLVETAFLCQGMICVREFFKDGTTAERALAARYDTLWKGVEWNWYTNNEKRLYWHWSPNFGWQMDFPLEGYNECLITYVLAAASPDFPIDPAAYHEGWARGGAIVSDKSYYGLPLVLKHNGAETTGGPLFWAHYSYLGLDPNGLSDRYADYWKLNYNHARTNYLYSVDNPRNYRCYGPDYWGLTASYSVNAEGTIGYDSQKRIGYNAHMPSNDHGVVSPTAAVSSIVYLPKEAMAAMRNFYENHREDMWGPAGFVDAHSCTHKASARQYLAIDQGPMVVMIENHRSGLLWKLFMNAPEVRSGLKALGFRSSKYDLP